MNLLNRLREQAVAIWNNLGRVQRVLLIAMAVTAIILIPLTYTWANTPNYAVVFSNLSEEDAGKIVKSLKEKNIPYQLRDSSTILVPTNQVYDVRLSMATEGLPQGSTVGFEIFSQNMLGMTEFAQKVNYQRALEGELARTIGSLGAVDKAVVHIVTPERSLLSEDQLPTTASVTIKQKSGQQLDAAQVKAITHLVASSVEGLTPDSVVVVDVNGNMLSAGNLAGGKADSMSEADTRRLAELSYSKDLQNKVQRLLDTALGPNRAIVQAYVALDWTERQTTAQVYDPNTSVLRSSQKTGESYDAYGQNQGGVAGTLPNIPPGVADTLQQDQFASYKKSDEINNYEVTMTETKENLTPGVVKNISISVLVDGITDEADLQKIRSVVAAASGINEARGDKLAVETIDFDKTFAQKQTQAEADQSLMDIYVKVGAAAAALLVLLAVLIFVQRLLRNVRLASQQAWTPILQPVSAIPGLPSGGKPSLQLPPSPAELMMSMEELPRIPEAREEYMQPELPQPDVLQEIPSELELSDLLGRYAEEAPSVEDQQMQQVITQLAEESPASVAEIIQMWLTEDDRSA